MRFIRSLLILASLLWLAGVAPVSAQAGTEMDSAAEWLRSQQQADGGYLGFSGASDAGITSDVVVGLAATGVDSNEVRNGGSSIREFLLAAAAPYSEAPGGAPKLVLAVLAMGENPRDFGGLDLIATITSSLNSESGLYDEQLYNHALAILALTGAGDDVPATALDALVQRQIEDGSWSFTGATDPGEGDSNTTSVVLQALTTFENAPSAAIEAGIDYLTAATTDDGSVVYQVGAEDPPIGDANSTALAIQAFIATGMSTNSDVTQRMQAALAAFHNPDSGAFIYRADFPDDNVLATAQALPALAGKPLPVYSLAVGQSAELASVLAAAPPGDSSVCVYFGNSRHTLCHGFRAFWETNGGIDTYGLPLSEEFEDPASGNVVQHFQRARFEWLPGSDPEHYDVSVTELDDAPE